MFCLILFDIWPFLLSVEARLNVLQFTWMLAKGQTAQEWASWRSQKFDVDLSPWPPTLTFNLQRAVVITHTHGKDQGQRSVGSKYRVETDGRTRPSAVPSPITLSVIINSKIWLFSGGTKRLIFTFYNSLTKFTQMSERRQLTLYVRPSVRLFVSDPTFEPSDHRTRPFDCVWIMTIARLGLKVKDKDQGQRSRCGRCELE